MTQVLLEPRYYIHHLLLLYEKQEFTAWKQADLLTPAEVPTSPEQINSEENPENNSNEKEAATLQNLLAATCSPVKVEILASPTMIAQHSDLLTTGADSPEISQLDSPASPDSPGAEIEEPEPASPKGDLPGDNESQGTMKAESTDPLLDEEEGEGEEDEDLGSGEQEHESLLHRDSSDHEILQVAPVIDLKEFSATIKQACRESIVEALKDTTVSEELLKQVNSSVTNSLVPIADIMRHMKDTLKGMNEDRSKGMEEAMKSMTGDHKTAVNEAIKSMIQAQQAQAADHNMAVKEAIKSMIQAQETHAAALAKGTEDAIKSMNEAVKGRIEAHQTEMDALKQSVLDSVHSVSYKVQCEVLTRMYTVLQININNATREISSIEDTGRRDDETMQLQSKRPASGPHNSEPPRKKKNTLTTANRLTFHRQSSHFR